MIQISLSSTLMMGKQVTPNLWRRDVTVHVPQVFPRLSLFPQKDLALDQAAIPVDGLDFARFLRGQRIECDTEKVAENVSLVCGEWNGGVAALHGPLEADYGGMHMVMLSDAQNHRIFSRRGVLGCAIALGTMRRSQRRVTDGLDSIGAHKLE